MSEAYEAAAKALVEATGRMFRYELEPESSLALLIGEVVAPVVDAWLAASGIDPTKPIYQQGPPDQKHRTIDGTMENGVCLNRGCYTMAGCTGLFEVGKGNN